MRYLAIVFLIFQWLPETSYGYVDPGSGHLLWQALLAGFFGGFFFLKRLIVIPSFLRRGRVRKGE